MDWDFNEFNFNYDLKWYRSGSPRYRDLGGLPIGVGAGGVWGSFFRRKMCGVPFSIPRGRGVRVGRFWAAIGGIKGGLIASTVLPAVFRREQTKKKKSKKEKYGVSNKKLYIRGSIWKAKLSRSVLERRLGGSKTNSPKTNTLIT